VLRFSHRKKVGYEVFPINIQKRNLEKGGSLTANRRRRQDLPTEESPMRSSLKR
jgi:hypothetical protein